MRGIFDTGSFELLVLSEKCEHCSKMPFYEIVQHNIPVFEGASFAAIVGLGDGPNEEDKSLLQKFGVNEFSICLERASGADGWITWGGELTEEEKTTKAIALPVLGEHHWAVHMTGLGIGPQAVTCQDGCGAILDSGTSLIAAPTPALMALSMVLPPINEDCSNLDSLPDLVFMLNGHELSLPPEAYVLRLTGTLVEAKSVWDILYFKPKVTKLDQCLPAFMQIDRTTQFGPLWILGMPFFRFFHSTFHINPENREERTVFITKAGEKCAPEKIQSDLNEDYEAPSTNGTHSPNMLALQKDKKGLRGQQQ